jgi:hypothetical protein
MRITRYSPILLLVLAGCLGNPSPTTKTGEAKIVAEAQTEAATGGDFLLQLLHEGRLPGLTTNDHGKFFCNTKPVSYPYSLTYYCSKVGGNSTNYYTIARLKKDSAWQLERALQTDSQGQIVQEWTVK